MKSTLFAAMALLCTLCSYAQENTTPANTPGGVEKCIFNVQTGAIGLWVNNEYRLSNRIALRTEVGLDLWYYDTFNNGSGSLLVPSISLEPRWYYNIAKRERKGKYTANNSANFVTLAVEYYPNLFTIGSKPGYLYVPNQMSFIPKWGIRRAIAKSAFNYELGFGVGYQWLLDKNSNVTSISDVAIDVHVRIGYCF